MVGKLRFNLFFSSLKNNSFTMIFKNKTVKFYK
jgi:hypothetical protein